MLNTGKFVICTVHMTLYLCTAAALNSTTKQMQQHKSPHSNSDIGTVTITDWKCKYCSYTNYEVVSHAVFGDYHDGRDEARFCIICYQYCEQQYTKR